MDQVPRTQLRQLVQRFGAELGEDPRRCKALLKDVCPKYKKEIFALVSAVEEGVPKDLLAGAQGTGVRIAISRAEQRLRENLGLSGELCLWAVESWAIALGVTSEREIRPTTRCPACQVILRIPATLRGKTCPCTKCGAVLAISASGEPSWSQTPESETPEDLYRQMAQRIDVDPQRLEQVRTSLGITHSQAERIHEEVGRVPFPPRPAAPAPPPRPSVAPSPILPQQSQSLPPVAHPSASYYPSPTPSSPFMPSSHSHRLNKTERANAAAKLQVPAVLGLIAGLLLAGTGAMVLFSILVDTTSTLEADERTPVGIYYFLLAITGGVAIAGSVCCFAQRHYLIAVFGACALLLGSFSPCCLLPLPVGVWLLIVLSDESVRKSFH